MMNLFKKAKTGYIVISILYIALGICLIAFPDQSLETICLITGIAALAAGIYKIVSYFFKWDRRFSADLDLLSGIFSMIAGAVLIAHPAFITNIFPILIGIVVIVDSAFKLQGAAQLRKSRMKNWWGVPLTAVIGILFGLLLVFNPFKANRVALIFVGISLVIDGVENFWTFFFVKRMARKAAPLEADYVEIDGKDDKNEASGR